MPCSSFDQYLTAEEMQGLSAICKEPPATCTDPWPAPPDPSPVPPTKQVDTNLIMRLSILECASRFVEAYQEAYQCDPSTVIWERLTQTTIADGIAQ